LADRPQYFAFYVYVFFGDDKVAAMSTLGLGAYWRLIGSAWSASPPCTIPSDDANLARISKVTPNQWKEIKEEVLAAWKQTDDGRYVQKRLLKEYRAAKKRLRAAKTNGQKGGRPRKATSSASGDDSHETHGLPAANPPPSYQTTNQTITRPDTGGEKPLPRDLSATGAKPTTDDLAAVCAYAREVVGWPLDRRFGGSLLMDFGLAPVVEALEHLAARRPSERSNGVRNPNGFLKSLIQRAEHDALPREYEFKNFGEWRTEATAALDEKYGVKP
jgi:uncharacterized protein YdaU (DUF1376 family)